jgi:hypothetical protein
MAAMSAPDDPSRPPQPTGGTAEGQPGASADPAWAAPERPPAAEPANPWAGSEPPGWGQPSPGDVPGTGRRPAQPPASASTAPGGWGRLTDTQGSPHGAVVVRRGIVAVKPLGLGDILEGAFRAIRHNPRVMIGFTLAVVVVTTLIGTIPLVFSTASLITADLEQADPDALVDSFVEVGAASLVTGVLTWLGGIVATGLLTVSVGQSVVDRRIGLGDAWRRVRGRVFPLIGQALLIALVTIAPLLVAVGIGVSVGLVAGGVAGVATAILLGLAAAAVAVWIGISWALAPAALVLEGAGITASLGRSWRLVRGAFWRTLGILLLANILISLIAQIITVPFSFVGGLVPSLAPDNEALLIGSLVVTYAVAGLVSVLIYPFIAAVVTLLYIDRRIRTEGLDIALNRSLAEQG